MAFTLEDFNKIWASTSPLTPYEFSDSNYQQGWNFIGATPPARQMWDFLQKRNDEKTQWLYNNKLSLSGGTMTGSINMNDNPLNLGTGNDADGRIYNIDNRLRLVGGFNTSTGSYIDIGSSSATVKGIVLAASDGNGTTKQLKAVYDGTLTWNDITFSLGNGTYDLTFYSFGYLTASATSLDLSFPYIVKNKNIRFNSLSATLRSYKGYLSPGGGGDILTGSTQGTWYQKNTSYPCTFRLVRSSGWGTNGENNTIVVGELTANVTVTDA